MWSPLVIVASTPGVIAVAIRVGPAGGGGFLVLRFRLLPAQRICHRQLEHF
jgi:hypothetical protein